MAGHDDARSQLLGPASSNSSTPYGSIGGTSSGSNSSGDTSPRPNQHNKHDDYEIENDDNDDDDGANNRFSTVYDLTQPAIDLEMNRSSPEKRRLSPLSQPQSRALPPTTTTLTQILTSTIPGLTWLRSYSRASILPDLMGALTVASLYIPLAFSFASVANVPPASSLYAFVFQPSLYALLGSCPLMVIGPEATGSLLVGAAMHAMGGAAAGAEEGTHRMAENALIAGAATALAGLILLGMGALRLGFMDNVLSRPLMKGFICGVGVVLVVKQAVPGLGLQGVLRDAKAAAADGGSNGGGTESAFGILLMLLKSILQTDLLAALFSVGTLTFVLGCAYVKKHYAKAMPNMVYFPDRFVAIVVSAMAVYSFDLESQGLDIVGAEGSTKPGLPSFNLALFTEFDRLGAVSNTALMIALLGYFESSVTGKSMRRPASPTPKAIETGENNICTTTADGKKNASIPLFVRQQQQQQQSHSLASTRQAQPPRQQHSADRELVALGTANILGGMFSTLPAFGGFGRSKLNLQAGAQTPMSGIFLSCISFFAILFVTPLLYYVPRATLAAMSCAVGIAMVEECVHDLVFFSRARAWREVAVMAGVAGVIFTRGMETGVVVGLAGVVLMVVKGASGVSADIGEIDKVRGSNGGRDTQRTTEAELAIKGGLSFVNAAALVTQVEDAILEISSNSSSHSSARAFTLDMVNVTSIDACCGQLLVEALHRQATAEVTIVIVCSPEQDDVQAMLRRCGLLDIDEGVRLASDCDEARLIHDEFLR